MFWLMASKWRAAHSILASSTPCSCAMRRWHRPRVRAGHQSPPCGSVVHLPLHLCEARRSNGIERTSRLIWLLSSEALSIRGNFIWIFGFIVLSFAWNYRSSSHLCLSTALSKCAGWVVLLLSTSSSARACFFTFVWAYPAIPSGIVLQR